MSDAPYLIQRVIRGRSTSYQTAAKQRERTHFRNRVDELFAANDPWGLLARPHDAESYRKLIDRWINLERNGITDEPGLFERKHARPNLKRTRADRVILFIETFCRIPEGPNVGKPLLLEDFQKQFIRDVFDNPHGTKEAILSLAKKNAKSALIAALVLAFVIGPEARFVNTQVVSGAMATEQAAIIYKYASKIADLSPLLRHLVEPVPYRKTLYGLAMRTEFRALAAVARSTQGISPRVAILDEVGQVVGSHSPFCEAVVTAQGAYDDAMLFIISTQAAEDDDWLSLRIDRALEAKNPHTICHLYAAPEGCALDDRDAWAAANPGLGTIRSIEDMAKLAQDAEELPSFADTFRNLNLNQRRSTIAQGFVTPQVWTDNGKAPTPLKDRRFYAALDLSAVSDLTSLELLDADDGSVHSFFWLPQAGIKDKERYDKADYSQWAKQGHLFLTPGPVIRYDHVAEFLRGVFDQCNVLKVAFDKQYMNFLRVELEKAGFTSEELARFVEFRQGFISMGPALREFERRLLERSLRHGNHPVLRYCAKNALAVQDPAGNRKFDKSRSRGRIDGMVALAMCHGVAAAEPKAKTFQMMIL